MSATATRTPVAPAPVGPAVDTPTAGWRGELARGGAGLLTLAGGGAALHQLLYGWHWFALLMVAGALVAVLGVAGRAVRLPAPAVVAAQLVAVAVLTTTLFARNAAVLGLLPGPAALRALVDTVQTGTDAINHYAPPAPAVTGIALLIVLGGGVGATVIDILVSVGRPALSGLVVLAFEAVTAFCLPAGVSAVSFLLGGAGWLVLLLAAGPPESRYVAEQPEDVVDRDDTSVPAARDHHLGLIPGRELDVATFTAGHHDSARAAGHDISVTAGRKTIAAQPEPAGPSGSGGWTGAVGRRTALASLGLAAIGTALLPGLSSTRLTRLFTGGTGAGGGGGGGGGQLLTVRDPLVELRRNLVQPANVEVLRYGDSTTSGEYLRLATLDAFDGESWTADPRLDHRRTDSGITSAEGLGAGVPRTPATISFAVADGLSSSYLPVPYPTTELQADGGWWFDPPGLDVMSYRWRATGGFAYVVKSLDLEFIPDRLRTAAAAPAAIRARDLTLPKLPPVVAATARRVTAEAGNDFDRAVALQTWFREQFTYDTSIVDSSSTGALVRFLDSKRGYCEQFSATMAVMARLLGIPARVVVGFLPGSQPDATGWVVTAHEAHAWPELYFTGSGWVRFEPTPAVQSGGEPDWTVDSSAASSQVPTLDGAAVSKKPLEQDRDGATAAATSTQQHSSGGVRVADVAGVLGAAAVAAAVPAVTARALRERRWRAAGNPTGAPHSLRRGRSTGQDAGERPGSEGGQENDSHENGNHENGFHDSGGQRDRSVVSDAAALSGTEPSQPATSGARTRPTGPADRTSTGSAQARATAAAVHADLTDMAWDHFGGWLPQTTPRQLARQLDHELAGSPAAVAAAARLVSLVELVRYAPSDALLTATDLAGVRADSELVRRTLARRTSRRRRVFTAIVPAALRRRFARPRPAAGGATELRAPATAITAEVLARRGIRS